MISFYAPDVRELLLSQLKLNRHASRSSPEKPRGEEGQKELADSVRWRVNEFAKRLGSPTLFITSHSEMCVSFAN